jgi:hypothetical protein
MESQSFRHLELDVHKLSLLLADSPIDVSVEGRDEEITQIRDANRIILKVPLSTSGEQIATVSFASLIEESLPRYFKDEMTDLVINKALFELLRPS